MDYSDIKDEIISALTLSSTPSFLIFKLKKTSYYKAKAIAYKYEAYCDDFNDISRRCDKTLHDIAAAYVLLIIISERGVALDKSLLSWLEWGSAVALFARETDITSQVNVPFSKMLNLPSVISAQPYNTPSGLLILSKFD